LRRPAPLPVQAALATLVAVGPISAAVTFAADPVTVQPGDTLTSIARQHDVRIGDLVAWNALPDPDRIYVGQRLRVDAPPSTSPEPAAVAAAPAAAVVHTVARGESLWTIARRYGTTVADLVRTNGISNPSRIFAGQPLTIARAPTAPATAPAAAATTAVPSPATVVHVVGAGESLWTIARRYGTTVGTLVSANGIANPSRIFAGQRLTIAVAPAAPAAAGPAMPASMAAVVASRDAIRRMIVEEAGRHGVPADFALAVAWQESGWQQGVVSSAGAIGVMQLMPATAAWVGDSMLGAPVDPHDTRQNVSAGVRLLAHYLARYDGDRDLVLAAYYQGQWATDHHGIYAVSRPYIASIRSLTALFGG